MFQKLVVEGLTPLRSQGLRLVIYLDDILLISPSYSQCLQEANLLVQLLLKLGFVVNLKKSELTPTQEKTFLGVAMDSRAMSFSLPPAKVKAFRKRIASMLGKATGGAEATLKEWQSIVGTLVSMGDCIPAIRLHLNSLMEVQARAIRAKTGRAIISEEAKRDLQWWKENLELWNGKSIIPRPVDLTMDVDASNLGLGAVFGTGRGDASPPLLSGGGQPTTDVAAEHGLLASPRSSGSRGRRSGSARTAWSLWPTYRMGVGCQRCPARFRFKQARNSYCSEFRVAVFLCLIAWSSTGNSQISFQSNNS